MAASQLDSTWKENFVELDPQEILQVLVEIPVARWNTQGLDPSIYHVGPMAQDSYAAFGQGKDDEHINTGDEIGIALLAIQGLHQTAEGQAEQIAELRSQNADLEACLGALERSSGSGSSASLSQSWLGPGHPSPPERGRLLLVQR